MSRSTHRATWKPTRRQKIVAALTSIGVVAAVAAVGTVAQAQPAAVAAGYADGKLLVSDPMTRTAAHGWGAAPVGGAYTLNDPSSFSLDGSAGTVRIPGAGQSRTASLHGVSTRDARATYALAIGTLPTSGRGVSTGVQLRSTGGSYYRADVRVAPNGSAELQIVRVNGSASSQSQLALAPLPFRIPAHTLAFLEFRATGADSVNLAARVWTNASGPQSWQAVAEDGSQQRISGAGGVALWNYASASSGAAAVTVDNPTVYSLVKGSSGGSTPTATPTPTPTPTPSGTRPTTPAPTPTPTPTQTPTQPNPPATSGGTPSTDRPATATRVSAGAAAIGSTSYPVPSGAIFVSTAGTDGAAGTVGAPLRTIGAAIAKAPSGSTIVVRAGSYHEGISIPDGKKLTIQSYPKEAVWLDGSSVVGGWAASGSRWVAKGWTAQFDASPTYTFGAPDNASANWRFVNPSYPMAAHPDQVWIDGVAQKQVASAAQVTAGTFFVDYAAKQIVLGSNPAGHVVRASDIAKAASIRGAGSTLRGIGITRFAPSVPHMGAVTAENPGITIENVAITDCATTGLFVMQSGSTVRNVTLARNGMLGASMSTADNLTVDHVLAFGNNTEHFNNSPVSGGVKISRSRTVHVTDSVFVDNAGPGLWFDESVYDGTVAHNDFVNNAGHGLITEISAKFAIVDNIVSGNTGDGMKINDTSQVRIWNNTVTGNGRNIDLVQDTRRASNLSVPGHDPRRPAPDPTVTWINGPFDVQNNVIAQGSADCLLCVQDYSGAYTAAQMGVTVKGNAFQRPSASAPRALVLWSRGGAGVAQYADLASFRAATGQDQTGVELTGTPALGGGWKLTAALAAKQSAIASPLPGDLAALAGLTAGIKQLGASS